MTKLTFEEHAQLHKLLKYSDRYEINLQFWPQQTAVFIAKDGIDLNNWGGEFNHSIGSALSYLQRINKKNYD